MTFYAVEDIVPKHPADGVAVRIIHGERMTVAFFTIAGGSGVPEHAHPHEQIGTVLKGKLELSVAGKSNSSPPEAPTTSPPASPIPGCAWKVPPR